jgi:hypothetical protein
METRLKGDYDMTAHSARSLFGARSMVGVCALFSLLMPFERAAFADSVTFFDNNDVVSFTATIPTVLADGGSISSTCSTHICTVTINDPNAFGANNYKNFNIVEPDGAYGDTLGEAGPGFVFTFISDTDPGLLAGFPGPTAGISGITDGQVHNANTVSFGTPSGLIPIDVNVQQNDTDTVSGTPEPSTALLISLGFAGVVGGRLLLRRRQGAPESVPSHAHLA